MVIKVGINGFGRIGRIVARACLQNPGLQLSAINDPAISVEYVSYLMKFDSTHGKLNGIITHNDDEIIIDGHHIKVFHEKYPPGIPWQAAGVQYVVEASGMFTNYEKASGHLLSMGVKRVIVTAPSADAPMIVLGVNDNNVPPDRRVISCASSTLYCLAPIIKVLEDSFGVEEGFITSIHAMTPSLKPLDGLCLRGRHWRDHRSIHQNIIPAPTGACKALGKILPSAKDKLSGIAFRVPIVNVSVLDLTVRLQIDASLQEIVSNIKKAGKSTLRNIIKVSSEESVSSDFFGESHSCVVDEASSIQLKPNFFKIICWYENEYSYACRIIDSIIFSENQYFLEIPKYIKKLRPITSSKMLQTDLPSKCNCNNEVASDITNVSLYTDVDKRTPISPITKKSTTIIDSNISKEERSKTDDLLKIWNKKSEMTEPYVKPIRCNFFQSCLGFPSSIKKVECNNRERLESVRREFTKMVSITEDLLRKTQSTQGVRSISKDEIKEVSRASLVTKEKDAKSCTKMNNKHNSVEELVDSKCSGDTILTVNDKRKDDTESSATIYNEKSGSSEVKNNIKESKNFIDISAVVKVVKRNDVDKLKACPIKYEKENINETFVKLDRGECQQITFAECKQIKNTFAANDGLSQNEEFKCVWNSHYLDTNKETENEKTNVGPENSIVNLPASNCEHLLNKEETKDFTESNSFIHGKDKIVLKKCELMAKKSNINLIDEALRKRNILLISDRREDKATELCVEENNDSPAKVDDKLEDDIESPSKSVLEHFPMKTVSEETFKCTTPENTVTTVSNDVCEERQDIFDKLDSTSGSDSNNSFEIKERKSQVIQLSDLTNSLEDLARLNNICRIIEISDELSDKLFSALDGAGTDMKKKKWSFKDLCARIKLDDFCNKVFGGAAVSHE